MTQPIYAIGDIHGQLAKLEDALSLIENDGGSDAKIVFLGDYTDRGPQSREVLDLLIEGRNSERPWTFIEGNHDRMFRWFLEDIPRHDPHLPIELYWLHERLGGDTTLASYGVSFAPSARMAGVHREARAAVPQAHVDFLGSLQLSYETDALFYAHAGIRPGVALHDQETEDLLWIRQEFHKDARIHPKLIVHGHTPVKAATHYGNRVNLDSGAGYGNALTAAVFEGRDVWRLTAEGRMPLPLATD